MLFESNELLHFYSLTTEVCKFDFIEINVKNSRVLKQHIHSQCALASGQKFFLLVLNKNAGETFSQT